MRISAIINESTSHTEITSDAAESVEGAYMSVLALVAALRVAIAALRSKETAA